MTDRLKKEWYPPIFQPGFVEIHEESIDSKFVWDDESPKRRFMASQLRLFINKLRAIGVKGELWIDGSFSTKDPRPADLDVLLAIHRKTLAGMSAEQRGELFSLTDISNRAYVRGKWSVDLYVIDSSNLGARRYWEKLFSEYSDGSSLKGIPFIKL